MRPIMTWSQDPWTAPSECHPRRPREIRTDRRLVHLEARRARPVAGRPSGPVSLPLEYTRVPDNVLASQDLHQLDHWSILLQPVGLLNQ